MESADGASRLSPVSFKLPTEPSGSQSVDSDITRQEASALPHRSTKVLGNEVTRRIPTIYQTPCSTYFFSSKATGYTPFFITERDAILVMRASGYQLEEVDGSGSQPEQPDVLEMALTPQMVAQARALYQQSELSESATDVVSYSELFQHPALSKGGEGFFSESAGKSYEAGGNTMTGFIVFSRTGDSEERPSAQDYKANIRLNINPDQMEQAWRCLQETLLSDENPFFDFKITDTDRLKRMYGSSKRVSDKIARLWKGGQFIFYCLPDEKPENLQKQAAFIKKLSSLLDAEGIGIGEAPVSDIQADSKGRVCFREKRFDRFDPNEQDRETMKASPLFKTLTSTL